MDKTFILLNKVKDELSPNKSYLVVNFDQLENTDTKQEVGSYVDSSHYQYLTEFQYLEEKQVNKKDRFKDITSLKRLLLLDVDNGLENGDQNETDENRHKKSHHQQANSKISLINPMEWMNEINNYVITYSNEQGSILRTENENLVD